MVELVEPQQKPHGNLKFIRQLLSFMATLETKHQDGTKGTTLQQGYHVEFKWNFTKGIPTHLVPKKALNSPLGPTKYYRLIETSKKDSKNKVNYVNTLPLGVWGVRVNSSSAG